MPDEISPEHLEKMRNVLREVPFAHLLGIELVTATHGSATLRLELRSNLKQNHGVLHGGAMAALIDTATAFAIVSQLKSPEKFTTVDLSINYLRPLTEGAATCQARLIRAGRRLFTISAEVHDDAGKLAAIALSTYIRLAT